MHRQPDTRQAAVCEREYYVRHILVWKGLKFHAMKAVYGPFLFRWSTDLEWRKSQIDTLNEYRHDFTMMHSA